MSECFKIIVINPGSTSTKVAIFENDQKIFSENIAHSADQLAQYAEITDQIPYRIDAITKSLESTGIRLDSVDAFAGICTGLLPMPGGVYEINTLMYQHGAMGIGSKHPGNLGPMLAKDFSDQYGGRSFVVNPSSVDEFRIEARMTGLREMFRTSRGHPLNQKEVAIRYAADTGKKYDEINLVVVHMGGGISVTAHEKGNMVDTADSTRGEGRMAPTRTGTLPAAPLVELCFSGKYSKKELLDKIQKTGGWIDHLGTSDALEVEARIKNGDSYAKLIYESTAYQIGKDIGAYAAVLSGNVDAILLTGGLAYSQYLTGMITKMVKYIAPVLLYPGEYEMEGLASGTLRVLRGIEAPRSYTGEPVFNGFSESCV
jgi:butyrate kinase